jgi:hypothetical protein
MTELEADRMEDFKAGDVFVTEDVVWSKKLRNIWTTMSHIASGYDVHPRS